MTYEQLQGLLAGDDHSLQENSLPTGLYNQLQALQARSQNTRGTGQDIGFDLPLQRLQNGRLPAYTQPALAPSTLTGASNASSPLQGLPDDRWPGFASPLAAHIAQANGTYDPNYASPRAKLEAQVGLINNQQNQAFKEDQWKQSVASAAQTGASGYAPMYNQQGQLMQPMKFLSGQVAGDSSGLTSAVLRSIQNAHGPDQTGITPLRPYLPSAGFGRIDPDSSTINPLDQTVYNDPVFRQTLAQDPEKAKFVYQRLTGRAFEDDAKASSDYHKKQVDTGYNFAADAIKNGATFDPVTRKWKVWQTAEPTADDLANASLGRAPQASRQLVNVTPDQERWLNLHHKNVTGTDLPTSPPPAPKQVQQIVQQVTQDPAVQAAITAQEKQHGITTTPQDKLLIAQKVMRDRSTDLQQQQQTAWPVAGRMALDTFDAATGYKPVDHNLPFADRYSVASDESNRNWLGQLLDSIRGAKVQQPKFFQDGTPNPNYDPRNDPAPNLLNGRTLTYPAFPGVGVSQGTNSYPQ